MEAITRQVIIFHQVVIDFIYNIMQQSFISNLFGKNTYNEFYELARIILRIGSVLLFVIYLLALNVHWMVIYDLLNVFTGFSLFFVPYVAAWIVFFDFQVEMEEENNYREDKPKKKPLLYKLTVVWGIFLLAMGAAAMYYTHQFKSHYQFECNTFLVDLKAGICHLENNNRCSCIEDRHRLVHMKGYEIQKYHNLTLCIGCEEWADDISFSYGTNKYYRK